MKWVISGIVVCMCALLVWGFTPSNDIEKQVKNYRKWTLVTAKPVDMTPRMALSCAGPPKWDQSPNPHAPRVFIVFVNSVGRAAMRAKGQTNFPDGTIIVKEKHARGVSKDQFFNPSKLDLKTMLKNKPELCTVMQKTGGKWSYYALGPDGKVIEGDTEYCASCHEGNAKNDFVFRPYVDEAALAPRVWR